MYTFEKIKHSPVKREGSISPKQFIKQYKKPAVPVILTQLTHSWPAFKKWDLDYLVDVAGDETVPVYSSKPATGTKHQHAPALQISLKKYVQMLKSGENDLRMFFYNILKGAPKLIKDFSYPELGLRFFKRLPVLFVGGVGAKVQMHYDIDLANLLLCHFGGRKHVLLIPPEQSRYVYQVPFSFSALYDIKLDSPDFEKFPALKNINANLAVLEHGDTLFIPSGYWHYIIYEDIGFSLTLRSMPTRFLQCMSVLKNILITRSIEGVMRKLVGQKWNIRNERIAITRTHKACGIKE